MNEKKEFKTTDIKLATYLLAKYTRLTAITPHSYTVSTFHFEQPAQALLDNYLAGRALLHVNEAISSYRHLIRDSRIAFSQVVTDNSNGN